eukprot:3353453-Pleurochrysis_carterae.AAC.1
MSQATPPGDNRLSWPPKPIHVPPPPTPVLHELGRAPRVAREEEESDALRTIGRGGESGAAHNSRRPLAGSAVHRNPRSAQFGTWSGNEAAAAP